MGWIFQTCLLKENMKVSPYLNFNVGTGKIRYKVAQEIEFQPILFNYYNKR